MHALFKCLIFSLGVISIREMQSAAAVADKADDVMSDLEYLKFIFKTDPVKGRRLLNFLTPKGGIMITGPGPSSCVAAYDKNKYPHIELDFQTLLKSLVLEVESCIRYSNLVRVQQYIPEFVRPIGQTIATINRASADLSSDRFNQRRQVNALEFAQYMLGDPSEHSKAVQIWQYLNSLVDTSEKALKWRMDRLYPESQELPKNDELESHGFSGSPELSMWSFGKQ